MHPIDEAILEGLMESRIYSVSSNQFYLNLYHPKPRWTEIKFGDMWTVIQRSCLHLGYPFCTGIRSSWALSFEKNKALEEFFVTTVIDCYLQHEVQKNMTE